jgi:hypothetical protein
MNQPMPIDILLGQLFLTAVFLYMIRAMFNWVLLNKVEGTNHPRISSRDPKDLILMIRHLTISCLKPWWTGHENRTMKQISNLISGLLYLSILTLIVLFVIRYKL